MAPSSQGSEPAQYPGRFNQSLAFLSLGRFAQNMADEELVGPSHGDQANPAQQFLSDVSQPLFTEQIDALVERSKAKRERSGWRRSEFKTPS